MANRMIKIPRMITEKLKGNETPPTHNNRSCGAGGCGPSVDIHQAAKDENIKAVKQHLASVRVNNPSP